MKSHEYHFQAKDLVRIFGIPILTLGIFASLMHLSVALKLLPPPQPALDMDRTILLHQAVASRSKHPAELLLVGDSSCLMDLSARDLSQLLGRRTLNLGTLSYLDLPAFALMLQHFFLVNSAHGRTVMLMLHPEFLRRLEPSEYHLRTLREFYDRRDHCGRTSASERFACLLGFEIFKGRVLSRLLPVPLPGEYGRRCGFTADLWRYLTQHDGSAVDPRTFVPQAGQGNAEYRLSSSLETDSRRFKSALPAGVKLIVGITPVPNSFAAPGYETKYRQMLHDWGRWANAEVTLAELPPTLPDDLFASTTHLTAAGSRKYTEMVARALETSLR